MFIPNFSDLIGLYFKTTENNQAETSRSIEIILPISPEKEWKIVLGEYTTHSYISANNLVKMEKYDQHLLQIID